MALIEKLKKKFKKLLDQAESIGKMHTFESLQEFSNGITIAQENGHIEIRGDVKSLKLNGKELLK